MRIVRIRLISQIFFFTMFVFLVLVEEFGRLKGYPVSLFIEADPLVAVATAISSSEVYKGMLWSLIVLIPTLFLGRFFCGWVCPYGSLHHFIGWLFRRRAPKAQIEANRYRRMYSIKHVILIVCLIAAAFGTLQIGLLDPLCLLHRSFAVSVLPALDMAWPESIYSTGTHEYEFSWVVAFILFGLLAANAVIPRFFCRTLCPLGSFLGMLSSLSLWRIHRDTEKCTNCDLCLRYCEAACDPHANLRKAECFVCMNCLEQCPHDALSFRLLPGRTGQVALPDLSGRRAVLAGVLGVIFYPAARASGKVGKDYDASVVRPPGSTEEEEFLGRCVKCGQCMRVCPTNVIQPAMLQAGLEGVWTPLLNMKMGFCQPNCVLCGHVCPTGAIQSITLEERNGLAKESAGRPVKVGTAFYDRGRCLPWAMDTPCVVCQEVCPVSPKAIYTRTVVATNRYGTEIELARPYIDPVQCIGCGACEHECPVTDLPAVRVTAIGETRSKKRGLLLEDSPQQPGQDATHS